MARTTKRNLGDLAPNEIIGVVTQTNFGSEPFGKRFKRMDVSFSDGSACVDFPMVVIAKPGDRFIFTIRPA